MTAHAVQDQKSAATEMFVPQRVGDNTVAPATRQQRNTVASIGRRRDFVLVENEQFRTKSKAEGEVARIAIKAGARVLFVDAADIVAAKAQGNYIALAHKSGCYLVRETMATAERKLTPLGFVRIHRSIRVNTSLVKDLRRDAAGTYVLRTIDGMEHPVGRAYRCNLKVIATSWLGV